jgi:hypothetical protein
MLAPRSHEWERYGGEANGLYNSRTVQNNNEKKQPAERNFARIQIFRQRRPAMTKQKEGR